MIELVCDVLVVGGGAAASRAALEAKRSHSELRVVWPLPAGMARPAARS